MKSRHFFLALAIGLTAAACQRGPADGEYTLHVLTTNDVHGSWFDSTYVGDGIKKSLFACNHYIDSVRNADGADNVLLVDVGDCLQGDNAAYYYNYVDTVTPHLFPRLCAYMKYDAVVVGNHDIETGHKVYDRVTSDLKAAGIPFLAGNAISNDSGKPYFPGYAVFKKAGLKVLLLGYTNPNMKAWLDESLWSGMTFESLLPLVQHDVDSLKAKVKPDVTIVAVHSGAGNGDGTVLESQAMDLYESLTGVDLIVYAHDHRPLAESREGLGIMNSGSHSRNVGHAVLKVTVKDGRAEVDSVGTSLIPVRAEKADPEMRKAFSKDFGAVRAFTLRKVGELKGNLVTREAYRGMCTYMNFIHTIGLEHAEISIAAPLTFNGTVTAGTLVYNDLFTLYPYENQMFVLKLSGRELKDYLEYSYDGWIRTAEDVKAVAEGRSQNHVLRIRQSGDARYSQKRWSFERASYNFDSAAGINYSVDVTKPFGERVTIGSMADGAPFDENREYSVAMTSYRAGGGGNILEKGAGVADSSERISARLPEYREMIYDYLQKNGSIDPAVIDGNPALGHWEFTPAPYAEKAIDRDMELMFR